MQTKSSIEDKQLAIVGASGHGKVVADVAEHLGYRVVFFDDAYPTITKIHHWDVLGSFSGLLNHANTAFDVFIAIGNNQVRAKLVKQALSHKFSIPVLIHPTATVSKYALVMAGTVVLPHAVINAYASVGIGCIINSGAIVEHDCEIGHFSHICPNASLAGEVTVGSHSWVGIASNVKQQIAIGNNTYIGSGSTVTKDVPSDVLAYGNPSKVQSPRN